MIEVTTLYCPEAGVGPGQDNSTHHLVTQSAGGGAREQVCLYCGETAKALAEREEGRGPRTVLFVDKSFLTPNGYVPGAVTEGIPGYGMMLGNGEFAQPWYWGDDLSQAQALAREANERMGISSAEAQRIIDESIRNQNIEEARQRSSEEKWRRVKEGRD